MEKSPNINTNNGSQSLQQGVAGASIRVSTQRQEDEETEQVQIAEIKARAKQDGNILPEENIFMDLAWSGAVLARPGLDAMRKAAADGKFTVLYTYDRGRIARKYAYQEIVIEELTDLGIRFVPLHDKEIETEEDRLFQGMQGLFAEWERTKIAERFRIAKQRRAEAGRLINGHALYGYRIDRIPGKSGERKDEIRNYVVNEEEAKVIKMVHHWFLDEDIGQREIIRRLFRQGILSPKGKVRWVKESVYRILSCETYATGKIYFNKNKAIVPKNPRSNKKYKRFKKSSRELKPRSEWIAYSVPTIISEATYQKIKEKLEHNKRYAKKNKKNNYLLSGLVWCECGCKRVGDPGGNGNLYYRCADRIYKFPVASECLSPGINAQSLEARLWSETIKYIANPTTLRNYADQWLKGQIHRDYLAEAEILDLEKKIAKINEEESRYIKAFGEQITTPDQFKASMKETARYKKLHQERINELKKGSKHSGSVSDKQINALCKEAQDALQSLDLADRKKLMQELIDKIIVKGRDRIEVWIHIATKNFHSLKEGLYVEGRNCWPPERGKIDVV